MYVQLYTGKDDKDISNIYFLLLTLNYLFEVNHIFYDDTLQMTGSMSVQCMSVV